MLQSQESLAEQSLSLLKEQSNKIKVQCRDLQLKQEQVRFLKETILALEQEKDAIGHQNHQLKVKLKTMASEIAQYNTSVVQKIYQENQELIQETAAVREENDRLADEIAEASRKAKDLESQLQTSIREKLELSESLTKLRESSSRDEKKMGVLEKQNKELQHKNIALQRQLDESSSQISYCSQQIDILTEKHHDSLKAGEKKLKQTVERMVAKEDCERLERALQEAQGKIKQLKLEMERGGREKQKLKFQMLGYKQKLLNLQINEQISSLQLRADLTALTQSVKLGKKVTDFQSVESEKFSNIFQRYMQVLGCCQKTQKKLQAAEDKMQSQQSELNQAEEALKIVGLELTTLRERREDQKQALESSYEAKLLEISIRLRKEEMSMASLRAKQTAFEELQDKFQREIEERQAQRESLEHTIQQLQKQSSRLSSQLTEALQLCEQSMLNRQCVTHYKYTLQDAVGVVHYLNALLLQRRERVKRLYSPFVRYYFEVHKVLAEKRKEKVSPLKKFRSYVWMVISIVRMRREPGAGRGLLRHVRSASERRQKIENLGVLVQSMSGCILKGGKIGEVLSESRQAYKWKLPVCSTVVLSQRDSSFISGRLALQN